MHLFNSNNGVLKTNKKNACKASMARQSSVGSWYETLQSIRSRDSVISELE